MTCFKISHVKSWFTEYPYSHEMEDSCMKSYSTCEIFISHTEWKHFHVRSSVPKGPPLPRNKVSHVNEHAKKRSEYVGRFEKIRTVVCLEM